MKEEPLKYNLLFVCNWSAACLPLPQVLKNLVFMAQYWWYLQKSDESLFWLTSSFANKCHVAMQKEHTCTEAAVQAEILNKIREWKYNNNGRKANSWQQFKQLWKTTKFIQKSHEIFLLRVRWK